MKRTIITIFNPLIYVDGIAGYTNINKFTRQETFKRHYHFYIKSRKLEETIKLANKQKNKEFSNIWSSPVKEEDILVSHPKGFVICFDSILQLSSIYTWSKHSKPQEKSTFSRLWLKTTEPFKDKSGIYMIINKVTKKKYIGKSSDLLKRLQNYCDLNFLDRNKASSKIYRVILKFGYSNFSFSILEYCDKSDLSAREQYFIDKLKPQYNIRKLVHKAGKTTGDEIKV